MKDASLKGWYDNQKNQSVTRQLVNMFLKENGIPSGGARKYKHLINIAVKHIDISRSKCHYRRAYDVYTALKPHDATRNILPSIVPSPAPIKSKNKNHKVRRIPSNKFYDSKEWRILRYQALKLCGSFCQCCGAKPTPGHPLHVDHIKPRSKYPHLELDLSNLQVLCESCNLGKLAWDETDWRLEEIKKLMQC